MADYLKSSRHSKITGDFGEGLVLYWLSKHGFESARIDHTGIDLIAKNLITNELMGISVKSRSRTLGTEKDHINIKSSDFEKVDSACKAFGCVPYFAIVVDTKQTTTIFILRKEKLVKMCDFGKPTLMWRMRDPDIEKYSQDKEITIIKFTHETNWWKSDI